MPVKATTSFIALLTHANAHVVTVLDGWLVDTNDYMSVSKLNVPNMISRTDALFHESRLFRADTLGALSDSRLA